MVLLLRHKIYTLEVFDGTLMLLGICALYAFLVKGDVLLGVTVTSSYTSLWWCLLSFRALKCFLIVFLGNISRWWCVVDCTFLSGWIRYKRLLKRHFYLLCYRLSPTEFFLFPFFLFLYECPGYCIWSSSCNLVRWYWSCMLDLSMF